MHWPVLAATDFFTVELWTATGLIRYHVLFVIHLASREVQIAGIVPEPNKNWMKQVARNLTDPLDGFPEFPVEGDIRCRKRLGGLLRYYCREAA